jgi:hypothetical protein
MIFPDYYKILDLPVNSSIEEIKKAYRKKARQYHPDINHEPDAKDIFIIATEAYEFLITNHEYIRTDLEAYKQAMDDWRKYRQERSRKRATVYARASYITFKRTKFYKTTRILDGTTIIFSFIISVIVVIYTITGYIYRLRHPLPGLEKPSVFAFLMLLMLGVVFFIIAFIYLIAYMQTREKHSEKEGRVA